MQIDLQIAPKLFPSDSSGVPSPKYIQGVLSGCSFLTPSFSQTRGPASLLPRNLGLQKWQTCSMKYFRDPLYKPLPHSHSLPESLSSLDLNPKHVSILSSLQFGHHLLPKLCRIFHSQVESLPSGLPSLFACITPAYLSRFTQESYFPGCLPHPMSFHMLGVLSMHLIHCSADSKFLLHLTTISITQHLIE